MARLEIRLGTALATCTNHQAQIKMHDKLLLRAVLKARSLGATWEQVGEALDMTQQGAHERFARFEVETTPARAKRPISKGQGSLAL
jgi:threonine dehydratase